MKIFKETKYLKKKEPRLLYDATRRRVEPRGRRAGRYNYGYLLAFHLLKKNSTISMNKNFMQTHRDLREKQWIIYV